MVAALLLHTGAAEESHPWVLGDPRVRAACEWRHAAVRAEGSLARVVAGWRGAGDLRDGVLVTTEYFVALGANLRLRLSRSPVRHVVWGLNQSRRVLDLPGTRHLASWLFRRSDTLVVHSRQEALLFSRLHALDEQKFRFVRWGFDLPPRSARTFAPTGQPYVCLIGRNNRDIRTFVRGLAGTGLQGVVITSGLAGELREEIARRPDIQLHEDLPMGDCLACIEGAMANVVLVNDDSRGAGHITMVAAMLMGKAQIISRAAVTLDYFDDGRTALGVPIGGEAEYRFALERLRDDEGLRASLGRNAKAFAETHLTHGAVVNGFLAVLEEASEPRPCQAVGAATSHVGTPSGISKTP